MDAYHYAGLRQRELLAEAEHARLGRLAALARRCCDACRPDVVRRLVARITQRAIAAPAC